jgi:hypothetical protein
LTVARTRHASPDEPPRAANEAGDDETAGEIAGDQMRQGEPEAGEEAEEAATVARAHQELEAAVASGASNDLLEFLARRFTALDQHSYTEFVGAGEVLVGREALAFLTRLAFLDPDDRPAEITGAGLSPEATRFLSRYAALYGTEVSRAWSMWYRRRFGDDWGGLRRDVYRDVQTGEYRVLLQVRKNNGQVVDFEGPPSSVLRFALALVRALNVVNDPEPLPAEDVATFIDAVDRLRAIVEGSSRREGMRAANQDEAPEGAEQPRP